MHESLVKALLNDVFRVLHHTCVPQHNCEDLSLITFKQGFKRMFVSVFGGDYERSFACRITHASDSWFCFVLHSDEPPDQLCGSERRAQLENRLFATRRIRARPEPNLRNCKSLNFQEESEWKSKVSKLSDVEAVETVEGVEVTRMVTRKWRL
jgi:hypothetical protein